jgi:hypothetical protein
MGQNKQHETKTNDSRESSDESSTKKTAYTSDHAYKPERNPKKKNAFIEPR